MPTMRKEKNLAIKSMMAVADGQVAMSRNADTSPESDRYSHTQIKGIQRNMSWQERAVCVGSDLDFTSTNELVREECLKLCNLCPVWLECLDMALEWEDSYAIMGGTTPKERKALL